MSKDLVSDELWQIVEPLLPTEPSKARGGRPRIPDRAVLSGIVFVLKSGIPWRMLPKEMGFGSGVTCWRRLRDWQSAGVWRRLHRALLDRSWEGPGWWTGRGRAWTQRACPPKGGRSGRAEPHRSRQARLQAPPPYRPQRLTPRRGAHRRQRARLQDLRGAGGRCRAYQANRQGSATQETWEAAR